MRWLMSLTGIVLLNALPLAADATSVSARFDLDDRRGAPFPSDRFTTEDRSQNTGLRVDLPKPDCTVRPNDCSNLDVISTLDGFNVQPRLSIPFDGAIDVRSVTSRTVFLVRLGSTLPGGDGGDQVIGINQVGWDVATTTLYAESDEILDQHTRYALLVTKNLLDGDGKAVKATKAFLDFLDDSNTGSTGDPGRDAYRTLLRDALRRLDAAGVIPRGQVVAASVFTTQSVTAVLEKIRGQIKLRTPPAADFAIGPGGTRAVYSLSELTDIVFVRQTGTAPTFSPTTTPFLFMSFAAPGAVGTVAFGRYPSPDYLTVARYIPFPGTRLSTPEIQSTNEIYFNLVLPAGPRPSQGWPVVISGHGSGGNKQVAAFLVAATMAAHGIATIAINAVGHGFGPLSTLTLLRGTDTPITLPEGGRGIDTNANGQIGSTEGSFAIAPRGVIRDRDARIQTAADLMQLVRVIEVGMDVDGDGVPDLDPSRIYYFGHSLGGNYGAVFLAADPSVLAGVLVAPGGPPFESSRLSPTFRRDLAALLAARVPSLLNGGLDGFTESIPLRDQPPLINAEPGAVEIQEFLDNFEWVGQAADVVPYGAYLRRAPLEGVAPKSVIIQFARGDRSVTNPTTTAILRAGDLADRATYYRFDLFLANNPTAPPFFNDPHNSLIFPPFPFAPPEVSEAATAVALAAQEQIAVFFASDGTRVIDPDGPGAFFETPIVPPLPEDAVFFP
jgi:dienelactone hydrolase